MYIGPDSSLTLRLSACLVRVYAADVRGERLNEQGEADRRMGRASERESRSSFGPADACIYPRETRHRFSWWLEREKTRTLRSLWLTSLGPLRTFVGGLGEEFRDVQDGQWTSTNSRGPSPSLILISTHSH